MKEIDQRLKVAILRVIRDAEGPSGSSHIAKAIRVLGFECSPRTIRLYLQEMQKEGLVAGAKRGRNGGRRITVKGIEEIKDAFVIDRVGFTAARVDTLTWQMDFNPRMGQGRIVLNITTVEADRIEEVLDEMLPVFESGLSMGNYLALAMPGDRLGEFEVPEDRIAIGTVCSVTINGALLAERIPTVSRFGGVLEMDNGQPSRFTDVIYYDGTSLDPLEVFIKAGLTSVRETVKTGHGRIGASFREVPTTALGQVTQTLRRLDTMGLGGTLLVGHPDKPVLEFPVHEGRTGIIIKGGLNPAAALEEAGIANRNDALSTLYPFERLIHYKEVRERLRSGDLAHARMS
jgi:HTH-type transcriptional regulator, global nitrogen regulator NrpRI